MFRRAADLDVNRTNIERLLDQCDVVLDGTDNFATRYLSRRLCQTSRRLDLRRCGGLYGVTMTGTARTDALLALMS